MNPIQNLQKNLRKRLPGVVAQLDPAETNSGAWWLDLKLGGHSVTVEWKPKSGFGISTGQDSYGEGSDEVFSDLKKAEQRIAELLEEKRETRPPQKVLIRRLRELRGLTQEQLAQKLGVKQSTISRFEGGDDMHLSTLKRFISSMGGELQIQAVFPEETITLEQP